jgi:copper chaperone CopZ
MHELVRLVAIVVFGLTVSTPAFGELRKLEVTVLGMDCAVCAHSIVRTLRRLDGVARAEVSLNHGTATIYCRPDNRLTLEDISRAIRNNGFKPRQARITALGSLTFHERALVFDMKGSGSVLLVEKDPANPGAYEAVYRARAASTGPMTGELSGLGMLAGADVTTIRLQSFSELSVLPAH